MADEGYDHLLLRVGDFLLLRGTDRLVLRPLVVVNRGGLGFRAPSPPDYKIDSPPDYKTLQPPDIEVTTWL